MIPKILVQIITWAAGIGIGLMILFKVYVEVKESFKKTKKDEIRAKNK